MSTVASNKISDTIEESSINKIMEVELARPKDVTELNASNKNIKDFNKDQCKSDLDASYTKDIETVCDDQVYNKLNVPNNEDIKIVSEDESESKLNVSHNIDTNTVRNDQIEITRKIYRIRRRFNNKNVNFRRFYRKSVKVGSDHKYKTNHYEACKKVKHVIDDQVKSEVNVPNKVKMFSEDESESKLNVSHNVDTKTVRNDQIENARIICRLTRRFNNENAKNFRRFYKRYIKVASDHKYKTNHCEAKGCSNNKQIE